MMQAIVTTISNPRRSLHSERVTRYWEWGTKIETETTITAATHYLEELSPHNPSSLPTLLRLIPPQRPPQHRRDPLQHSSSTTKSSAEASSTLVSPTLGCHVLIMVVCVVLKLPLIDSLFLWWQQLHSTSIRGRKGCYLLHSSKQQVSFNEKQCL
jgi:hypothetical protein